MEGFFKSFVVLGIETTDDNFYFRGTLPLRIVKFVRTGAIELAVPLNIYSLLQHGFKSSIQAKYIAVGEPTSLSSQATVFTYL